MRTALALTLVMSIQFVSAQSADDKIFQEKSQLLEGGVGIALYFHSDIYNKSIDTTYRDSIGSMTFPIRYQYGITDWLGIGGMFRLQNFYEDANDNSQAIGFDLGLRADLHYLRTRRLDFSGALGFGFSRLSWKSNDSYESHLYGSGIHYDAELICRFYFSDHIGMHICYGRIFQNLPNLILDDNLGNREEYGIFFKGGQFSAGLNIKF